MFKLNLPNRLLVLCVASSHCLEGALWYLATGSEQRILYIPQVLSWTHCRSDVVQHIPQHDAELDNCL